MSTGPQFGYGIQRLIDQFQRYTRATTPVYMRIRNFTAVNNTQWAQMGFRIAPSGGAPGTTDVLIAPPPSMTTMSLHNIGMSGGKLRFGAKQFVISAGWVNAQQSALGLAKPENVFNGPQVVGLVNESMLYSIEDIQHEVAAGYIPDWILQCNANELR